MRIVRMVRIMYVCVKLYINQRIPHRTRSALSHGHYVLAGGGDTQC
jgi:hypothetical protein